MSSELSGAEARSRAAAEEGFRVARNLELPQTQFVLNDHQKTAIVIYTEQIKSIDTQINYLLQSKTALQNRLNQAMFFPNSVSSYRATEHSDIQTTATQVDRPTNAPIDNIVTTTRRENLVPTRVTTQDSLGILNRLISGMTRQNDIQEIRIETTAQPTNDLFQGILNLINRESSTAPTAEQIATATRIVRYSDLSNPTQTTCPISHETFEPNTRVQQIIHCGHYCGRDGMRSWFQQHSTCPICRYDIRTATNTQDEDSDSSDDDMSVE